MAQHDEVVDVDERWAAAEGAMRRAYSGGVWGGIRLVKLVMREDMVIEEGVGTRMGPSGDARVGEVSDRFSGPAKDRRAVNPTHGEHHREGHEAGAIRGRQEDDAKANRMMGVEMDAVKAIRQVHLNNVGRSMMGVSFAQAMKEKVEGTPKLHCLRGSQRVGLRVDAMESVVHDSTGAMAVLRDDANGAEAEAGEGLDISIGKDEPLALLDHVGHLVIHIVPVFNGRLVWTATACLFKATGCPRVRLNLHRSTGLLYVVEETGSRMRD